VKTQQVGKYLAAAVVIFKVLRLAMALYCFFILNNSIITNPLSASSYLKFHKCTQSYFIRYIRNPLCRGPFITALNSLLKCYYGITLRFRRYLIMVHSLFLTKHHYSMSIFMILLFIYFDFPLPCVSVSLISPINYCSSSGDSPNSCISVRSIILISKFRLPQQSRINTLHEPKI
jgi:hypothetical protein